MTKLKISLTLEKTISNDVSIMVDQLRASTTISVALDKFNKIIPAFSKEEAIKIAKNKNAVLAGERLGEKIQGFTIGNSPVDIKNYKTDKKTLVLTTTNGVRVLREMNSKVLIGALANSRYVGKRAVQIANSHIDIVMAGRRGHCSTEDYLAGGDIINSILNELKKTDKFSQVEINEFSKKAAEKSLNYEKVKESILNSSAGLKLRTIGYGKDVDFSIRKNITENVGIYKNNIISSFKT